VVADYLGDELINSSIVLNAVLRLLVDLMIRVVEELNLLEIIWSLYLCDELPCTDVVYDLFFACCHHQGWQGVMLSKLLHVSYSLDHAVANASRYERNSGPIEVVHLSPVVFVMGDPLSLHERVKRDLISDRGKNST
jgi:hypothetical protein